MQKNTPLNGVHFTFSSIRKALGACVLVSALAFSSQLSAQPDHYIWVGGGADNAWTTLANWEVNEKTPTGKPGGNTTTLSTVRVTIDGPFNTTNKGNITLQGAYDPSKLGEFNALELLNGASLHMETGALRVTGAAGVTRNVVIGAGSSLTSDRTEANSIQIGSVANNTSVWTVQGTVNVPTALLYLSAVASETENGGLIVNVDGGTFIVSSSTVWRSALNNRTDGIAQFNISNDGFLNLGVMTQFEHSTNAYVNFADSSGEFNFLYGAYSTRESVETLIDTGKIRIGGNPVTHNLFNIEDTASGWRITTAIPEPSTYALFAGICTLAAVAFVKRRRR